MESQLPPTLCVRHSLHEEYIAATLRTPAGTVDLGARAHNHVLLELARVRIEDRDTGLPLGEQGWIHLRDLENRLGRDVGQINVWIHRLRRLLKKMRVPEADMIVERRWGIGELRLGTEGVEVGRFE